MEFVFLPAWANIIAVIAIIGIIVASLMPKVGTITKTLSVSAKPAYYIASMAVCVALATFFCIVGGINTSTGVLVAYGVILFFGLIACAVGEGGKDVITVTAAIVVICLVLATLVFSNAAFAAIWISVVGALFFGGQMLFPKEKNK